MSQIDTRKFCTNCNEEKCSSLRCQGPFKCKCKCSTNSLSDLSIKIVTFIFGLAIIIIGSHLSVAKRKILSHVISSALLSIGLNSILPKSITSLIHSKRIYLDDLFNNAYFSALTGLTTGMLILTGEKMIQLVNSALITIIVRALIGSLVSMTAKFIEYLASKNSNELKSSLLLSSFSGCITGLTAYLSFILCKNFTSVVAKSGINVLLSGLANGVCNFIFQLINIKLKRQEFLDINKLIYQIMLNMLNRCVKEALRLATILNVSKANESGKNNGRYFKDSIGECELGKDCSESNGFINARSLPHAEFIEEFDEEESENEANSLIFSLI